MNEYEARLLQLEVPNIAKAPIISENSMSMRFFDATATQEIAKDGLGLSPDSKKTN